MKIEYNKKEIGVGDIVKYNDNILKYDDLNNEFITFLIML